jgi:hypothetical protein
VQFAQPHRSMTGFDIAEYAAGSDRGELLIILDEPDAASAADDELHSVSNERVSAIPASSMITKADRPMRCAQSDRSP